MIGNKKIFTLNEQENKVSIPKRIISINKGEDTSFDEYISLRTEPKIISNKINYQNINIYQDIDNENKKEFFDFLNTKQESNNEKNKGFCVKKAGDTIDFKTKWKTEKCHYWEMYKTCKFGENCAFAHGNNELKLRNMNNNYKTKPCKQFFEVGYCPYGSRCQFSHKINLNEIHNCREFKPIVYSNIISNLLLSEEVSIEVIKRPRLNIFEKIVNCSSKEKERNRLKLYKDIIHIRNQISVQFLELSKFSNLNVNQF